MNNYGNTRDLTASQPARGLGLQPLLMFTACGHQGRAEGATFRSLPGQRGRSPWRCAACTTAKAAR
jgi:hypothetical protein